MKKKQFNNNTKLIFKMQLIQTEYQCNYKNINTTFFYFLHNAIFLSYFFINLFFKYIKISYVNISWIKDQNL